MRESFFTTLECQLLDLQRFRTQPETKLSVFDFIFIEGFYNPCRHHSSLSQVSPANFERLYSTTCQAEAARYSYLPWIRDPATSGKRGCTAAIEWL
jgi:hypothetical protein